MTPETTTDDFCLITRARVARTRSEVIPEGDGAPSTHTPPAAAPDQKVTPNHAGRAPLPFAASPAAAIPSVIAMTAIVVTASVAALLSVYADHPDRWRIVAGFLAVVAGWCAVLAIPALARHRHPQDDGEPVDRAAIARWRDTGPGRQSQPGNAEPVAQSTRPIASTDGNRSDVDPNRVTDGRRSEPRRAEAGGRSPKRRPQAAGAAEGGGEDRRPLGNGETSCTGTPEVNRWR